MFRGFGQAKFPDGGSDLGSNQFSILPPAASKNNARFKSGQYQPKSGQYQPKNNHLTLLI